MEEKLILCPNCRGALTICNKSRVSCPRCRCEFDSSEAKEVEEGKKEQALEHAVKGKEIE